MKKLFFILGIVFIFVAFTLLNSAPNNAQEPATWWKFQSIDTMKSSRDLAREKLNDSSYDIEIEKQVSEIAATGATHIAIATPYDDEFYPILKRWVSAARSHNLNIWFRGNWSGWEGWFEYPKINRDEHIEKTREFILKHKEIFEDATYKYTTEQGEKVYDSQETQQLWKKGQIEFGSVALDSAGYVARYAAKRLVHKIPILFLRLRIHALFAFRQTFLLSIVFKRFF